ncbi:MAG: hypothetical protein RLZZ262_487 [Bacteroidota bacterium]|jgi:hypothetical protein
MKKSIMALTMALGLCIGFSACKKEYSKGTPLEGRVLLINSNTPVDQALVRFIRSESNGLFNPPTLIVTQEVITGRDGKFVIPDTTSAEYVQAWGLQSIYGGEPSQEVDIEHFLAVGGAPKVYLTPPAWLRIRAIDVEPLNPEYTHVQFSTQPYSNGGWQACHETSVLYAAKGNIANYLKFKKYNSATQQFEFVYIDSEPIPPFDTTDFVLEY